MLYIWLFSPPDIILQLTDNITGWLFILFGVGGVDVVSLMPNITVTQDALIASVTPKHGCSLA